MVLAHRATELHRSQRVARRAQLSVADAARLLDGHVSRIEAATSGIAPARLRRDQMLGTWTPVDVLAHLRACSDTCSDVIPKIVASESPRLHVVGPREIVETSNYRRQSFSTSFGAFTRQRAHLLALLRSLGPADASRAAVVVEGTRARRRTIRDYTDWLARHEGRHVEQLERFGRRSRASGHRERSV